MSLLLRNKETTVQSKDMDFLFALARQPLFRLIAAVIVLLIVEAAATGAVHPAWGFVAIAAWVAWVWAGRQSQGRRAVL